ncbi:MAG: hypothetical protein WC528_01135 [Patescibacteria group bacterium]
MLNIKSKNKNPIGFLAILVILGWFFVAGRESLAWTEPMAAPPGGNVQAPINVSATAQAKIGSLTLGVDNANPGLLRLYPAGQLSGSCSEGQLAYWSGSGLYYCAISGASTVWRGLKTASGFVLEDDTQLGWGYLKNDDNPEVEYALKAVGYSQDGGLPYYTGIEGAAGDNSEKNYGIYGTDAGFNNAYAGYFQGNVGVSKSTGGETRLQVGTNNSDDQVSLCLNDSGCLTSWPLGGGSYWTQNDYDTYLTKTDKNLALGGSEANESAFYVNVANNIDNNVKTIIGQPEDLLQEDLSAVTSYFCGDGACMATENNTNCSADCPPVFAANNPFYNNTNKIMIWSADEANYGTVCYGVNSYDEHCGDNSLGQPSAGNAAYITGYTLGTSYHAQVKIWDQYGNVTYSIDIPFTPS